MSQQKPMPYESGLEHGIDFLKEGYRYILNRRLSMATDVFETSLLRRKAICLGGEEAAALFYDPEKFIRQDALPHRVQETLVGKQGVQSLDGEAHADRKRMFMSLMSREELERLERILEGEWERSLQHWEQAERIILYDEIKALLARAACSWAGIPLAAEESERRINMLAKMYETPMAFGPVHWSGRNARNLAEKWMRDLIRAVRAGEVQPEHNTALAVFAHHRDHTGEQLPVQTAAVELLNILRPITAISVYVCFTALALEQYPEEKAKLLSGDPGPRQRFVQEVRRFYPFFPMQGARVKEDFEWNGYHFEKGTLTLLDLYGTNHDPSLWDNPERFQPDRFIGWKESPFSFIPQGGGDYLGGHRCAGEWITIQVMNQALDFLLERMTYTVPPQDLGYRMDRMPSLPKDGFIMAQVTRTDGEPAK